MIEIWVNGMKQFYQGAVPIGIPGQFFTEAFQGLTAKGVVPEIGQQVGIRKMDVTSAQLTQALTGYEALMRTLEGFGYQRDEQYEIAILQDGVIRPMSKDWKVVQLLLQDILDVNKKQLEGVYNLPADASFYVPFQGYKLGFGQGGGGTGAMNWRAIADEFARAASEKFLQYNPFEEFSRGGYEAGFEALGYKLFGPPKPEEIQPTLLPGRTLPEQIDIEDYLKRYGQQVGPPVTKEPYKPGIGLERIEGALLKIKDALPDTSRWRGPYLPPGGIPPGAPTQPGYPIPTPFRTEMPKIENKLSLNINTTAQLLVDGRLMAAVVKQYLYEDLLRGTGISGSNAMTITI